MAFQPDPYNGFTNDSDRRRALLVKEIRVCIVAVVCCIATVFGASLLPPDALPSLMKVLYRFSAHG